MALPETPPIDLRMIADEIGLTGTVDLIQCLEESYLNDKSLPVDMLRFLGYSHVSIDPPTEPTFLNSIVQSNASIFLTWGAGTGEIDHYRIERSIASGSYTFLYNWDNLAILWYTDNSTVLNQTHQYRVRAENAAGVSSWVYSSVVTPTLSPPGNPKTPQYDNSRFYPNGIGLGWTAPTSGGEVANYRVEFGNGAFIANVTAPTTNYIVPNSLLTYNDSYTFRVRAENAAGVSSYLVFPSKTYL